MIARPWYATNARDLLEARRQGLKPDGPVVVSLVGGDFSGVAAATINVKPDMPVDRLDWRMLVNLHVWLWANQQAKLEWLLATASRIAHVRPRRLVLRFEAGKQVHDVDIGTGIHIPAVRELPATHDFWWSPINCSDTAVATRLRAALLAVHPFQTIL